MTLGEEVPRTTPSSCWLGDRVPIAAFMMVWYLSMRDAWVNGRNAMRTALNSVRKQYQMLLSDGFPVSDDHARLLSCWCLWWFPPILFGFAIVFTNYGLYHTPPAKLVDCWVGFKNFINIFTLSTGVRPSSMLQWTVVWTLLATTLQCSVGVLLAILVNQKDLRFETADPHHLHSALGGAGLVTHLGVCRNV